VAGRAARKEYEENSWQSRAAARGSRCNTGGVERGDIAADALAVRKGKKQVRGHGPVSVFLAMAELLTSYL
jgi:hypothetical protein